MAGTEKSGKAATTPLATTEKSGKAAATPPATTEKSGKAPATPPATTEKSGKAATTPLATAEKSVEAGSAPQASAAQDGQEVPPEACTDNFEQEVEAFMDAYDYEDAQRTGYSGFPSESQVAAPAWNASLEDSFPATQKMPSIPDLQPAEAMPCDMPDNQEAGSVASASKPVAVPEPVLLPPKAEPLQAPVSKPGIAAPLFQKSPAETDEEGSDSDLDISSLPPPMPSPEAIDQRLRRVFKPRKDGSYMVPDEFVKKWLDVKCGRLEVCRLFERSGFDPDIGFQIVLQVYYCHENERVGLKV